MSTSELNRFRAILAAGAAEWNAPSVSARASRWREVLISSRSSSGRQNGPSPFLISIVNLANFEAPDATLRRVRCQELLDREPEEMQALTLDQFANAA
jgi:hypothetical protein